MPRLSLITLFTPTKNVYQYHQLNQKIRSQKKSWTRHTIGPVSYQPLPCKEIKIKSWFFFFWMETILTTRKEKRMAHSLLGDPFTPRAHRLSQRLSSNRFPDCREREKRERTGGGGGGEILVR